MDVNFLNVAQLQFKRRLIIHIQVCLPQERNPTNALVVVGQDKEVDIFSRA